MTDMEKVIKGLEETEIMLSQAVDRGGGMSVIGAFNCLNRVTDTIAFLKEQKPIKPVCFEHRRTRNKYQCGSCGSSEVFKEWEYCPWCGTELKWE